VVYAVRFTLARDVCFHGFVCPEREVAMYYQPSPLSTFYSELSYSSAAGPIKLSVSALTHSDSYLLL